MVLEITQGHNKNIKKLMFFNFRNRTIFWDIPKWNKGQTNQNGWNIKETKITKNEKVIVFEALTEELAKN